MAYKELFKSTTKINKLKEGAVNAIFSIRLTTSIRSAIIPTLIGNIKFYIINANTLFLLSLSDIDKKGIILNSVANKLIYFGRQLIPVI